MQRWHAVGVLALMGAATFAVRGDEPHVEESQDKSYWMEKKLELSQGILAALATGDMDAIADKATSLKRLSRLEGWARRTDAEEYRRQLRLFRGTTETLVKEANDDNLDGAALAFTHMTLSCVNCHQHLRDNASGN